jgi:DNA replication protein DnaC
MSVERNIINERKNQMLTEPMMTKLLAMKLNGIVAALEEQRQSTQSASLSFEDRLGLLVERQWLWKENRAMKARLQFARLRQSACVEDIDYRQPRGLQRGIIEQLSGSDWLKYGQNCIITGLTGVGKTYLACALAHQACRDGYRALYFYAPKLFRELSVSQADGSLPGLLKKLAKTSLLVIDDFGLEKATPAQYRDLLEVLDDRHGLTSTLITSQFPPTRWHELIGDATVADAILDRLIHGAHRIELKGESMRKPKNKET